MGKKINSKQIEVRRLPILPSSMRIDERIIYPILLRVPPEVLHREFRLVCKSWFNMISWPVFIQQQLAYATSKPSLVLQDRSGESWKTHELELKESVLDDPTNANSFVNKMGEIRASCNGLLLVVDRDRLQVWNHVTKRIKLLPKCPSGCRHREFTCACGLAYDSLKVQYKVVHMYADQFGFEIMTLGSGDGGSDSSWRKIPGPFETIYDRPFDISFYWRDPILVKSSVLHWPVNTHKYIISMNVSDEVPRKTSLPTCRMCAPSELNSVLVDMGGFLALLSHVNKNLMEFWVLKDYNAPKNKNLMEFWGLKDYDAPNWVKQHSISMDCIRLINCGPQLNKLETIAYLESLEDGAVIVFGHKGSNPGLYLYDVRRGRMKKYKKRMRDEFWCFALQKSLVSWNSSNPDAQCKSSVQSQKQEKGPRVRFGELGFSVLNLHEDMLGLEID